MQSYTVDRCIQKATIVKSVLVKSVEGAFHQPSRSFDPHFCPLCRQAIRPRRYNEPKMEPVDREESPDSEIDGEDILLTIPEVS
jgi:hypothetical protein